MLDLYDRKRKEIASFLESAVANDKITNVDQLSDADKDWLTALNVQSLSRDPERFSCITDADNYEDTLDLFIKSLLTAKPEDHYELAECLKKNAFDYFKKSMNELLEEAINEVESRIPENPNDEFDGDYSAIRKCV